MSSLEPAPPFPPPAAASRRRHETSWVLHACGAFSGFAFTGVIIGGLFWFSEAPEPEPEEEIQEIRAVDIPEPPPPPPQTMTIGTPLPPAPMIFDEAPSTSNVRIAPTPIPIAPLHTMTKPTFSLKFDFNPGDFQPTSGDWQPDVDHVFQRSEVDQQVVAVFKKAPRIPTALLREVANPRVNVIFVVNIDGSVSDVRLLRGQHPEFDRAITEAISEWRFRAAMRKGRKVRQMAEMQIYVKAPSSSPFSVD